MLWHYRVVRTVFIRIEEKSLLGKCRGKKRGNTNQLRRLPGAEKDQGEFFEEFFAAVRQISGPAC